MTNFSDDGRPVHPDGSSPAQPETSPPSSRELTHRRTNNRLPESRLRLRRRAAIQVLATLTILTTIAFSADSPAVEATSRDLLTQTSTWLYEDSGVDLGTAWQDISFNDTSWQRGRGAFGAGDSGLSTVVDIGTSGSRTPTIYFRIPFSVSNPSAVEKLKFSAGIDDGAVIHLNGVEVARDNMGTGTVRFGSWAASYRNGSAETHVRSFDLNPDLLVTGTNVLAVEIHQAWKTSSDLRFDPRSLDIEESSTSTTTSSTTTTLLAPTTTAAPTTTTAPPTTTTAVPSGTVAPAPTTTTTTAAPLPPSTPTAGIPAPAGWRLYWSDEFNGTTLNTSVWRPYNNTYGDGNNEIACLTPNNVSVSGGSLRIQARRETITCPGGAVRDFSSGFLGTRENGVYFPRFARYEMRASLPHGQGLWPAFWLRHRDGSSVTEVDIMEYFHAQIPGSTTGTLHYQNTYNVAKRNVFFETPTTTPGFHTWAMEIEEVTPGGAVRLRWFLNGTMYLEYTITNRSAFNAYAGQGLFDIAINMAVGGNWNGHPDDELGWLRDLNRWADGTGDGIQRATFPSSYVVDYVRVYTR